MIASRKVFAAADERVRVWDGRGTASVRATDVCGSGRGRSARYTVEGIYGDTGATRINNQWRSRRRRSLGACLCAGAAGRGRGGDDEAACGAAWGGGHGHQKARELSSGSSGTDEARAKLQLLRGAEARTKTE